MYCFVHIRAILDLKNQRDKLHQYQKRITGITDRETAIAKQCLARNDRKRALLALRRKKYQESLLAKTDTQLEQLEQLTSQVEFALVQKDVLFGLQQGTQVLQTIHKEIGGLEGVEKLMGETEEARTYQEVINLESFALSYILTRVATQEISQMLAGQLSNQDEDEVEDELEVLQGMVLPNVPASNLNLPAEREEIREQKAERMEMARERERSPVPLTG